MGRVWSVVMPSSGSCCTLPPSPGATRRPGPAGEVGLRFAGRCREVGRSRHSRAPSRRRSSRGRATLSPRAKEKSDAPEFDRHQSPHQHGNASKEDTKGPESPSEKANQTNLAEGDCGAGADPWFLWWARVGLARTESRLNAPLPERASPLRPRALSAR